MNLFNPYYDDSGATLDEFEEEIDLEDIGDLSESDIQEMREFVVLAREESEFLESLAEKAETEERQCVNCYGFFEIPATDAEFDMTDLCEYCEEESEEQWS